MHRPTTGRDIDAWFHDCQGGRDLTGILNRLDGRSPVGSLFAPEPHAHWVMHKLGIRSVPQLIRVLDLVADDESN